MYELMGMAHVMRKRIDEAERERDKWKAHAKKLEEQLAVEQALEAGLRAQIKAFGDIHKDSPLFVKTNHKWNDAKYRGQRKERIVIVFEQAFDKKAIEVGFKDPKRIRID